MNYRRTLLASYLGYITQAICNNLPPLLFATFHRQFGITLEQLGLVATINFSIQMLTDIAAARFLDKIGYRAGIVLGQGLSFLGLLLMGFLPMRMGNPFAGILLCIFLNAVGGGLLEVLVGPIVQIVPGEDKERRMSVLHSFYCWGHVLVVLLSTAFFRLAGVENWPWLFLAWSILPLFNTFFYGGAWLPAPVLESERIPLRRLFANKIFWIFLIMMIAAGASEQAMGQWSSLFAEEGLGISKTMGDLLGPCAFAALMGISRLIYGLWGAKLRMGRALLFCAGLCVASYLATVFSPSPLLAVFGMAFSGLCVGLMWPGVFSMVAGRYPQGGTAMFAILALAGDVGCSAGPGLVGVLSGSLEGAGGALEALKSGLLAAAAFPLLLFLGILWLNHLDRKNP